MNNTNIKFVPHLVGGRSDGDYDVVQNTETTGRLRWGTGSKAGWYFVPGDADAEYGNPGRWVAALEDDMETVFFSTRQMILDQSWNTTAAQQAVDCLIRLGVAMPHQTAVANLLRSSWISLGILHGMPSYSCLSAVEKQSVTEQQFADVARWVSSKSTVFCFKWRGAYRRDDKSVMWWLTRTQAERHIARFAESYPDDAALYQICELTLAEYWEACRA